MNYSNIVCGKFISRPNRFVALVEINGKTHKCHVKNTGRCREILVSGAKVYLEDFSQNMKTRKLMYSLIACEKIINGEPVIINIDSQAPNKVIFEALKHKKLNLPGMGQLDTIKPEAKFGNSRLDFYVKDISGKEAYIEVKGVTLEDKGVVSFPDAPSIRAIKHLSELSALREKGYNAYVIFVIQMEGIKYFTPNKERHKDFADALLSAHKNGVNILAFECEVSKTSLALGKEAKTRLN